MFSMYEGGKYWLVRALSKVRMGMPQRRASSRGSCEATWCCVCVLTRSSMASARLRGGRIGLAAPAEESPVRQDGEGSGDGEGDGVKALGDGEVVPVLAGPAG